jgi:ribosome assembly protein YihI (activator of Der GTPase)
MAKRNRSRDAKKADKKSHNKTHLRSPSLYSKKGTPMQHNKNVSKRKKNIIPITATCSITVKKTC